MFHTAMSNNNNFPKFSIPPELMSLVPGFLERRQVDFTDLRNFLNQGHFEEAKKIAHKIKGNGGSYGFDQLTVLAARLEDACSARDKTAFGQILSEMESYVAEMKKILL